MKKSYLYLLIVVLCASTFYNCNDKASQNYETQIDSIFQQFDAAGKPGAAIAVVQDGELVFKKGYGSANLEYDIPVTPKTIFHIASVSKQFTVFSILLLQSDGKLDFDDDIRKYIPEVPNFGKTITLRHLASHTSGLRDQWDLLAMAGWRLDDVITKEHVMKIVAKQKALNFNPGEEFIYSNTGFTLLAEVVARVSGMSFSEYTKANIFEPLKMDNTLFFDDHEKLVKNRAYSYEVNNSSYKKRVLSFANVGATSLFTSVEDLSLWAINFETQTVGNSDIFNQMNSLATLNNGQTFAGAYGQFISDYKGLQKIEHTGSDAGYRSYLGRFLNENFSVMVFSNLANSNPEDLAMKVSEIYLGNKMKASQPIQKATTDFSMKSDDMEKFAGHYWNKKHMFTSLINFKNDTLREYEDILTPISKNSFELITNNSHVQLKFKVDDTHKTMIGIENGKDTLHFTHYQQRNYTTEELKEFIGKYYNYELSTHYELKIVNNQLVATHSRQNDIGLNPIMADMFSGNSWFMSNFRFERGSKSSISGIYVSSARARDVHFEKQDD